MNDLPEDDEGKSFVELSLPIYYQIACECGGISFKVFDYLTETKRMRRIICLICDEYDDVEFNKIKEIREKRKYA